MKDTIKVAVVTFDGSSCVFNDITSFLEEMTQFFQDSDSERVTVFFKEMTVADYENLEEFQGW